MILIITNASKQAIAVQIKKFCIQYIFLNLFMKLQLNESISIHLEIGLYLGWREAGREKMGDGSGF